MEMETELGKADLHIHSGAGDGIPSVAEILEYVEQETDLDLIAITDHDLIHGALEARHLIAKGNYRIECIVGMEITTLEGHLLAYDLEKPIRMLLPLARTIQLVHEQGGFCVVPHPTSWLTRSVGYHGLQRIMKDEREDVAFDGLEILNSTLAGKIVYEKVLHLNREDWHLPELGGSDAHSLEFIGSGHTVFPGRTASDFRRALKENTTHAGGRFLDFEDHLDLMSIAGEQMLKSLVIMPGQHIKRAIDSLRENEES